MKQKTRSITVKVTDATWRLMHAVIDGKKAMNPPNITQLVTRGIILAVKEQRRKNREDGEEALQE
jgi:hypothetical protein